MTHVVQARNKIETKQMPRERHRSWNWCGYDSPTALWKNWQCSQESFLYSPLPAKLTGRRWTIRRWNLTLWASQWRIPLCAMGEASLHRLRTGRRWPTWRRLRTRSQRRSVSPIFPNVHLWTWSLLTSPTLSWRDHAGERAVTNMIFCSINFYDGIEPLLPQDIESIIWELFVKAKIAKMHMVE